MEIVQLETIEDVYKAYNDVKNTFENLENEVNIDEYLHKVFKFGNVFSIYDEIKDRFCGFAALYINDFNTKSAYITLIGIGLEYKKQHLGTQLLLYCEKKAKESGMVSVSLEVKKSNSVAISFYMKNNYEFDNTESETSLFLTKKLRVK